MHDRTREWDHYYDHGRQTPKTKESLIELAMFKELYQDNLLEPKLTRLIVVPGLHFYTTYTNNSEANEFVALLYD